MKYIDNPALSRLAKSLTHAGAECSVHTRMEAYSCKNIKRDKKLFKALENAYQDEITNSPPLPSWMALEREAEITPFGPIDKQSSRKTLYLLIATLNIAFPDHDFSEVRPSHFIREASGAGVLNALSNTLVSPSPMGLSKPRSYSAYPPTSPDFFPSSVPTNSSPFNQVIHSPLTPPAIVTGTHPTLFKLIDDVIGLSDCEIYSYSPDIDDDPHADDCSDDEDGVSSSEEESSTDDDLGFEFDDYDVDEASPEWPKNTRARSPYYVPPPQPSRSIEDTLFEEPWSSNDLTHVRMKHRGALLWSSHWFFLNRKLKRILFVSVWARSKGAGRVWGEDSLELGEQFYDEKVFRSERFHGWNGDAGAGARAMGLRVAPV